MRFAERRGLLKGRRLSIVQEVGLRILIRQDDLAEAEKEAGRVKRALVSSGSFSPEPLFPDWFPSAEIEIDADSDEDVLAQMDRDYDLSGVSWQSPSDLPPEELKALESFFGPNETTVTVPSKDLDGD